VTTITVETLQYWIPGRDTSLGDILTNSFGCYAGILCADVWRVVLVPSRRVARRLAIGWTLLWAVVLTASAALTHISLGNFSSWGVWRPEDLQHDYFNGKILSATAGGLEAPGKIDGTSEDVRRRLSTDSVVVEGSVAGAALTGLYSSIASVYNFRKESIFMLGQRRGSLVFSLRMKTADFGVRTPMIRLDSVFPRHRPTNIDTIRVAGGIIHRQLWIRAEDHGVVRERTLPLDAGLGWSYFLPFDYEYGTEAPWLTALWLAGLAAPALAWATRAGRATVLAVAASLALALLAIPFLARAHPTPWWEWAALAAGSLLGFALGSVTVRASPPA
jgi:hypothetical protein